MAGRPKRGTMTNYFVSGGIMNDPTRNNTMSSSTTTTKNKQQNKEEIQNDNKINIFTQLNESIEPISNDNAILPIEQSKVEIKVENINAAMNVQMEVENGTMHFTPDENIEELMNVLSDSGENDINGERKKSFSKKIGGVMWKKTSGKVRAKERKLRQNKKLRKMLIPKNALMALHEIKGIKIGDFILKNKPGCGFSAEVTVNNIQYEAYGSSKNSARNSACEKALRDLIISRMLQKKSSNEHLDTMVANSMNSNEVSLDEDVQMKMNYEDEDDVPMINLASFALYKLFLEWENEGFEVPEFRTNTSSNNTSVVDKPKNPPPIRHELPANWETMHPATLLCMMRPGVTYVNMGSHGNPPNTIQNMGVIVDGENFVGIGRSKKIARREVAALACNKLFGTNFTSTAL